MRLATACPASLAMAATTLNASPALVAAAPPAAILYSLAWLSGSRTPWLRNLSSGSSSAVHALL